MADINEEGALEALLQAQERLIQAVHAETIAAIEARGPRSTAASRETLNARLRRLAQYLDYARAKVLER